MDDNDIKTMLQTLGKKRRRITREADALRQEIHGAAIRAAKAGWNNQKIAKEIGVTREIIRRHVGPTKVEAGHGEQEHS